MHRALLFSMKPMPPMSAARLNTVSTPSVTSRRHRGLQVGLDVLDVVEDLVPLVFGLQSTARIRPRPLAQPPDETPDEPPAPVTRTCCILASAPRAAAGGTAPTAGDHTWKRSAMVSVSKVASAYARACRPARSAGPASTRCLPLTRNPPRPAAPRPTRRPPASMVRAAGFSGGWRPAPPGRRTGRRGPWTAPRRCRRSARAGRPARPRPRAPRGSARSAGRAAGAGWAAAARPASPAAAARPGPR